jgi:photosystem II stability/assembly factor-like uncharacterized protein
MSAHPIIRLLTASLWVTALVFCRPAQAQWIRSNGPTGGFLSLVYTHGNDIFIYPQGWGVRRSGDNGATWTPANTGLPVYTPTGFASIGTRIFVGTTTSGLFASDNNGNSWFSITNNLPGLTISALFATGNTLYLSCNGQIYRTDDLGATYTLANSGLVGVYIQQLAGGNGYLFGSTYGNGIFSSADGGTSWTPVNSTFPGLESVSTLGMSGNNLYAGNFVGELFLSTDYGVSWTSPLSLGHLGQVISIAISGVTVVVGFAPGGVYYSPDSGSSWSHPSTIFDIPASLAFRGTDILAATYGGGLYRSTNNGNSWSQVPNPELYIAAQSFLAVGDSLMVGTAGAGAFLSADNGISWMESNSGLENNHIKALASSGQNIFAAGANGVYRSGNQGKSWIGVNNGLSNRYVTAMAVQGSTLFIALNTCFQCSQQGIFLSTDQGATWSDSNTGLPANATVTCLAVQGSRLYAGTGSGLFVSSDSGGLWSPLNPTQIGNVYGLLVNGSDVIVCTNSQLFTTRDSGNSWTSQSPVAIGGSSVSGSGHYVFAGGGTYCYRSSNDTTWSQTNAPPGFAGTFFVYHDIIFDGNSYGVYYRPISEFPVITSVSTSSAEVGTSITIQGEGFSTITFDNTISFNGATTQPSSATATALTVTVPAGATSGALSVMVEDESSPSVNFAVLAAIRSVAPSSGPVGTQVTMELSGFVIPYNYSLQVMFGGVAASNPYVNGSTLTATVPPGAGSGVITVTLSGQNAASKSNFHVLPAITSFSPAAAPTGGYLTISGTSFSPVAAADSVTINGVVATVVQASANSLVVTVPDDVTTGAISVSVGGMTAVSQAPFKVIPTIYSFSPKQGIIGTVVTIDGTGFNPAPELNGVSIGTGSAKVTQATTRQLTVVVPAEAFTSIITVSEYDQSSSTTDKFVVAPGMLALDPAAGFAGSLTTLVGSGFDPGSLNGAWINGVSAEVTNVSSTQITVIVPSGATTGSFSILQGGERFDNGPVFTILNLLTPEAAPAANLTPTSFTARWFPVPLAAGYEIDISPNNFATYLEGYQALFVTDTAITVTYSVPETPYQYRVRSANAFVTSANSNVISTMISGVKNETAGLSLFPNPANRTLTVSSLAGMVSGAEVVDPLGQTTSVRFVRRENSLDVDISELSAGWYILRVISDAGLFHMKFIRN